MRIWLDADNGPHVLIFRPLLEEFASRGHEIVCTARKRTKTPELLDLYGIPYIAVGAEYGRGMAGKVFGTLGRAAGLVRAMRGRNPDVSFGHGSRALPIASRILGVPSVTMYDYEWVDARLFNWGCRSILLPESIDRVRCREAGIAEDRIVSYPGFKEELYLGGKALDGAVAAELGLRADAVHVLVRPPASTAHYHNPAAEVLYDEILRHLARESNLQLILLPRSDDQLDAAREAGIAEIIVPDRVFDGPSLVAAMDLVVSGGGTMTREAAIMGVPAYSFFQGRRGRVDDELCRRDQLVMITSAKDVVDSLRLEKRHRTPGLPDPAALVRFIADTVIAAAD